MYIRHCFIMVYNLSWEIYICKFWRACLISSPDNRFCIIGVCMCSNGPFILDAREGIFVLKIIIIVIIKVIIIILILIIIINKSEVSAPLIVVRIYLGYVSEVVVASYLIGRFLAIQGKLGFVSITTKLLCRMWCVQITRYIMDQW